MALQDDIIGLLSNIGEAGDRATARQERGIELYENIGKILGDSPNYRRALRELTGIGSREDMTLEEEMRNDPGLSDRVASIIEKYMEDAATIGQVPDDMIVDDTRAAERMMETAGIAPREAASIEELPAAAPRTPVSVEELPPMSRPELDEVAMASMAREFGGERQMNQERLREMGLSSLEGGAIPLRDRLMEGQGEPMSGTEQLMFASAFIPAAAIPQIGRILGMGASQIRNFLRAGDKGSEAMGQILQQRAKYLSPDELAEVRLLLPKPTPGAPSSYVVPSAQVGGQARQAAQAAARTRQAAAARARQAARGERSGQPINIEPSPAQRLGSTQGSTSAFDDLINRLGPIGMAGGMSVRDNILRNYAMMADGGSTTEEMGNYDDIGNYDENVVQQMRRLKREFGTDKAVDLMREMYPEYRIGNSGLIMGKPKRSNDDSFLVPNAPFEIIQNYLKYGHPLGKDYRDLKKKQ